MTLKMTAHERAEAARRECAKLAERVSKLEIAAVELRVRVDCYERMLDAVFRGMATPHGVRSSIGDNTTGGQP